MKTYKLFHSHSLQYYLRMNIDMKKQEILEMEQKIKDLDFYHYQRTGKFPE